MRPGVVSRSGARGAPSIVVSAQRATARRGRAISEMVSQAGRRESDLRDMQWVAPLGSYRITGTYGLSSSLWSSTHTGLDLAAPTGTPVMAVSSGQVSEAGWAGSYGYRTIVTATDGTQIWYCHQSRIDVEAGQSVDRAQQIGLVGATGNVTGAHLHIEVRPGGGDPVDPYAALMDRGVLL
ncbi:M23 family metallopeptidase [Nocardioides sp. Soil777]|uniref:M23 family metallopeptidase n=1 Tax=Nocardioides sp. Soil777 TaxID=1736409 RepID=UPI0009EC4013|nr:M23 family metallopeptidase [Nocardioides sp. Soil777]